MRPLIREYTSKLLALLEETKVARMRMPVLSLLLVLAIGMLAGAAPPQATAKPTFSLPFSLANLVGAQPAARGAGIADAAGGAGVKPYTGLRRTNDSLLMIYFYDQTVAVVELGPKKLLLNCELIEVIEDDNRMRLLKLLSKINQPLEINFKQMVKLMWQCQQVENIGWQPSKRWFTNEATGNAGPIPSPSATSGGGRGAYSSLGENETDLDGAGSDIAGIGILDSGPFSLLSGIIPGTKWCGTGDIASTYHDLGRDRRMDRCCRTHDLCPTKVRAFSSRYNLTNKSLYSKSHCVCDDMLFSCLKKTNTSASQLMGSIYFNLVQIPCLESDQEGRLRFRKAKDGF